MRLLATVRCLLGTCASRYSSSSQYLVNARRTNFRLMHREPYFHFPIDTRSPRRAGTHQAEHNSKASHQELRTAQVLQSQWHAAMRKAGGTVGASAGASVPPTSSSICIVGESKAASGPVCATAPVLAAAPNSRFRPFSFSMSSATVSVGVFTCALKLADRTPVRHSGSWSSSVGAVSSPPAASPATRHIGAVSACDVHMAHATSAREHSAS